MCCSVNGSLCLVCCVFVDCLVKQFAIWLGVVVILLLNVIECLVWVEVLCWIDRVWSSKESACFACDPIVHLSVRSIGFVFVCGKLSPHLRV